MEIKKYSLLTVAIQVVSGENFEEEQVWAEKLMRNARALHPQPPMFLDLKIEPQIQRALILYTIINQLIKDIGADGFQDHCEEVGSARQSQEFCVAIVTNFVREHTGRGDLFETGFKIYEGWLLAPNPVSNFAATEDFMINHAMLTGSEKTSGEVSSSGGPC